MKILMMLKMHIDKNQNEAKLVSNIDENVLNDKKNENVEIMKNINNFKIFIKTFKHRNANDNENEKKNNNEQQSIIDEKFNNNVIENENNVVVEKKTNNDDDNKYDDLKTKKLINNNRINLSQNEKNDKQKKRQKTQSFLNLHKKRIE